MIRDLYDNSIVAYKTASRQTVSLVLDIIRLAMKRKKKRVAAELQLYSDRLTNANTIYEGQVIVLPAK